MLTITKRPCHIGGHMNATTEKHGDEDVPALDIALDGMMLSANELNALLSDPHASAALFNREGGQLAEPMFPHFKPFVLKQRYEGATVRLVVGGLTQTEVALHECKLRRITLEPQTGGMTQLSLAVRARPDADLMAVLLESMNTDADVEIADAQVAEKGDKQRDLPLSTAGEGEEPEEHPDPDADHDDEPEDLPEAATA